VSVLFPENTAEAVEMLRSASGALIPVAGGTDLLVRWPEQLDEHDRDYLDLSALAELKPHRWTDDALVLGGLTTYWDIITDPRARYELPLLVEAGRTVGAVQIQARGTWAGNIMNASPAADGVPVLMAYGAVVVLRDVDGEEHIPLDEFYQGYKEMRRRPEQLVTAIRVPLLRRSVEIFEKVGTRAAQAITKVGVAITRSDAGWRVVANSVAPTVRRCRTIEHMLEAEDPVHGPEDLLPAIREDVSPIDDIRSTARYRETVMARVLYHHLRNVCPFVH
jgi:CO/xanthine dehydrogenase FAD-binding subunit